MRGKGERERYVEDDDLDQLERPIRHHASRAPRERDARDAWEPIICPSCGGDHPDATRIRFRRSGSEFMARCTDCGSIAARFVDGVWSA